MPRIHLPARQLHIEYAWHGPEQGPVLVLIMGLGMQLLAWPAAFIQSFTDAGFRVLVFDNRDAGLSGSGVIATHTRPSLALLSSLLGTRFTPPYHLRDLALDTLALADALDIDTFDVIGVSMGGMIGQVLAVEAPQRVQRLISIMSSAGPARTPRPRWPILLQTLRRPPAGAPPQVLSRHFFELFRVIGALGEDEFELAPLRERLERTVRRAYNPEGTTRQLLAILASPDRSADVARIKQPTLIVHGLLDPLVPPQAARYMARLLPHARLELIPEMGHYLPLRLAEALGTLCLSHLHRTPPATSA